MNLRSVSHSSWFISLTRLTRLFYQEWVIVVMIVGVAAFFRLYQLGDAPPGLYRDEAYNGLDALDVLDGKQAIYFEENNGREPLYIYLVAASVQIFGRTALAVRAPAALVGILTTLPLYYLVRHWFGRQNALITAFLWATTLWPIHLSRIGFRVILLPFCTTLFLALATRADAARSHSVAQTSQPKTSHLFWFLSGSVYAIGFYTYLAMRLTPLFLIVFLAFLWLTGRWERVRVGAVPFLVGFGLFMLPLLAAWLTGSADFLTRTSQVSIFHPDIHQGNFWGTLWKHIRRTAGMFVWQGDTIRRHNPVGRSVFDAVMAVPFLLGCAVALSQWRKPARGALLLWTAVFAWGTILAEDAPHFLRSAGLLPFILIFPAIGLSQIGRWSKLPPDLRSSLIAVALICSTSITYRDYFIKYALDIETAYFFEATARSLGTEVNETDSTTPLFIDQRFFEGWASLRFLVDREQRPIQTFKTEETAMIEWPYEPVDRGAFFVYPYSDHSFLPIAVDTPATIMITTGDQVRGDLDLAPSDLYILYDVTNTIPDSTQTPLISFQQTAEQQLDLYAITTDVHKDAPHKEGVHASTVIVTLLWHADQALAANLTVFAHIIDRTDGALLGQIDAPPTANHWQAEWWQPDLYVSEQRTIDLPITFNSDQHKLLLGAYTASGERLSIISATGDDLGTTWSPTP